MKTLLITLVLLCSLTLQAQSPRAIEANGVVTNLVAHAVTTTFGDQIIETDVTITQPSGRTLTFRVAGGDLNGLTMGSSYESVPKKGENIHLFLKSVNGQLRLVNGDKSVQRIKS